MGPNSFRDELDRDTNILIPVHRIIQVEVFEGDHGVLHEQAEKFNRVLKDFLDQHQ